MALLVCIHKSDCKTVIRHLSHDFTQYAVEPGAVEMRRAQFYEWILIASARHLHTVFTPHQTGAWPPGRGTTQCLPRREMQNRSEYPCFHPAYVPCRLCHQQKMPLSVIPTDKSRKRKLSSGFVVRAVSLFVIRPAVHYGPWPETAPGSPAAAARAYSPLPRCRSCRSGRTSSPQTGDSR